jgi:LysR family transcriptional regulator, transcriptional activator of the cysJI operon
MLMGWLGWFFVFRSGDGLENFRLRVFRAVAAEMSFRKAAEVLHLSQPAVSQHIHALEEEAGVRLFDRARGEGHGSQISLTEAGRVLLGYAKSAAATMAEAQRALAALNDEAVGALRLGASTTVAQYVLPRILGAFLRQHPQVKLSLVSGNTEKIVEAVAEERVELGIIEGPAMRRDVKTERLVQDEMVLIVSPNHAWAAKGAGAIRPEELTKVPLLLRERGSGSRRVVERALKKAGLPLRSLKVAMELDSTEAIISGVEAELGVGFVSRCAVSKVLQLGSVKVVEVKGLEIVRDFSFVRLAGTEATGAAAAFQRFAMGSST